MRTELRTKLLDIASTSMKSRLPAFALAARVTDSDILFVSHVGGLMSFYIYFYINSKRDAFTIEIGWSEHGRWPMDSGGIPRDWPEIGVSETKPKNGEFRFRLPKLWVYPKKDPWWEINPRPSMDDLARLAADPRDISFLSEPSLDEAALRLERLLNDAMNKIEKFALPYFYKIAHESGLTWSHCSGCSGPADCEREK